MREYQRAPCREKQFILTTLKTIMKHQKRSWWIFCWIFLVQFSSAIHVVITVRWRKLCTGLLLYKRVRSIIVFEMMKSMRRHYRGLEERTTEEMGLQTFAKSSQWRRRRDVLRQCVPQPLGIKQWPENLGRQWLKGGCVSVSVKDHATIKCVSCFCFIAVD